MFETNQLKKEPSFNLVENPFFNTEVQPEVTPLPAGITLEDAAHQIRMERWRKRFNLSADTSEKEVENAAYHNLIERLYGDEIRQRNGGVLPPPALSE